MAWLKQRSSEVALLGPKKATWLVGWRDPFSGKQQTKSFGAGRKGKKEAEKFKGKLELEIDEGKYLHTPARMTWASFRERYEQVIVARKRPKTQAEFKLAFDAFERLIGPKHLRLINSETIDEFATLRANEGVAAPTVNKALRCLKAALRKAEDWGRIGKAPKITKLPEEETDKGYCSEESFARLYGACDAAKWPIIPNVSPGDWWRAILLFAWCTGWRINQILAVRWLSINLDAGWARSLPKSNKNKKDVRIPLEPVVVQNLRRIEGGKLAGHQLVFPCPGGYGATYEVLDELLKAGEVPLKENGMPIRWHDFRRSFATYNEANLSRFELKVMMQHSSLATTDRYIDYAQKARMVAGKVHVPFFVAGQSAGQALQTELVQST